MYAATPEFSFGDNRYHQRRLHFGDSLQMFAALKRREGMTNYEPNKPLTGIARNFILFCILHKRLYQDVRNTRFLDSTSTVQTSTYIVKFFHNIFNSPNLGVESKLIGRERGLDHDAVFSLVQRKEPVQKS